MAQRIGDGGTEQPTPLVEVGHPPARPLDAISELGPEARASRSGRKPAAITLEACYAQPTAPPRAAIADALRLLAVWALRAAKQGDMGALGANQPPDADLDLRRPGSDECATMSSSEEE